MLHLSRLQHYKWWVRTCWHVAIYEQLKWTNKKSKEEKDVCLWVWECVQACMCVSMFSLAQIKLNCWLYKCTVFSVSQNNSFFTLCRLWTIRSYLHGPNLFWHPGLIHQEQSGLFALKKKNYAWGQTVINDWSFVLAQMHALRVMCLYSFSTGFHFFGEDTS